MIPHDIGYILMVYPSWCRIRYPMIQTKIIIYSICWATYNICWATDIMKYLWYTWLYHGFSDISGVPRTVEILIYGVISWIFGHFRGTKNCWDHIWYFGHGGGVSRAQAGPLDPLARFIQELQDLSSMNGPDISSVVDDLPLPQEDSGMLLYQ